MAQTFWTAAQEMPNVVAVIDPDGTGSTSGELHAAANQLVDAWRAQGLQPGDVIATLLPNCRQMLEVTLAALQAGWYVVPVNHHLVGPEIAYILADSEAKVFVAHERFDEPVKAALEELHEPATTCLTVGGARDDLARLRQGRPTHVPDDRTAGGVMNYTSGTTGRPKGVRRPLPGVTPEEAFGFGVLGLFGLLPRDSNVHLVGSPLYHTAVLAFATESLHLGHTVVLMDGWSSEGFLERIERYRVTTSHMVPTQFHRLLSLPEEIRDRYDVTSLRHMVHAAAPCPPEVKRRMIEWWGNAIDEYYAATEGGGTLVGADEWLRKPGTVGRPWPISEVRVVDEDGQDLPPGAIGTVYLAIEAPLFEYHKDSTKTAEGRLGKFFTVGDVGYLDEDGYLFLCDRKADMIISGGANIYPAEIEGVLLGHPDVADAAVFGVPHEDWGEEIKAVIEPRSTTKPDDALRDDILDYCASRLARFKTPRSIDFVNEMPRDPNGKLLKRKLRDPYWADRARAI